MRFPRLRVLTKRGPLWAISGHCRALKRCRLYPKSGHTEHRQRGPLSASSRPVPLWSTGFGLATWAQKKPPKVLALGALHKETFRPPHREWILLRSAGFNKPIRVDDRQRLGMVSALEAHCLVVAAVDMNRLARI
jgi:hypothetical protein